MRPMSSASRAERIAELEGELRWHKAEIESNRRVIEHHEANVRDIEAGLAELKEADAAPSSGDR